MMGTLWSIQVYPEEEHSAQEVSKAIDAAYDELARIESVMSEWKPESPISQVNSAAGSGATEVPAELADLLRRAIEYGYLTGGVFDVTWRGVGELWQFGNDFEPPEEAEIQKSMAFVDFRKVSVDGNRVEIPRGFSIGLGGIAKGYAIDQAVKTLDGQGFENVLVNGGGDIFARGSKGSQPWQVGIRKPRGNRTELLARVAVSGAAVVTSGDYERFQIVDGVRYHHIVDPRNGRPARGVRSSSVIAPKAEIADVLATALFVLGPGPGLELARSMDGTEVLLIDDEGRFWMTAGFEELAEFF
jgi:thiamine biosynthesis lipoprotein